MLKEGAGALFVKDIKHRRGIKKVLSFLMKGHSISPSCVHTGRERLLRGHHEGTGMRQLQTTPLPEGSCLFSPNTMYAYLRPMALGLRGDEDKRSTPRRLATPLRQTKGRLGPGARSISTLSGKASEQLQGANTTSLICPC